MRRCFWLVLPLALGCERAQSESALASAVVSAVVNEAPAPRASSSATAPDAPQEQVEIRACAPLDDGELRLLDVDPHAAARMIAIARRTPVVAAGKPTGGCAGGRCRGLTLKGPAETDLAAIGFEVTRADGLLLAGPAKLPARRLLDGGPKLDIERERAAFSELALALGSERLDRKAAGRLEGELTMVARNVSSDRLLDAAAALAGGRLRANGARVVLDGVRGVPAVGRVEIANCAAPVCPIVMARCSDTKKLRLVAVMRRPWLRPVPQPIQLGEGIKESDTSAFVADEAGFAWHVRVGDHVGRDEPGSAREGAVSEPRRVDAISCGTVTLDDGTTITPAH